MSKNRGKKQMKSLKNKELGWWLPKYADAIAISTPPR